MQYKAWQIGACVVSLGLSHRFNIRLTVKCSAVIANSTCVPRLWSTKLIHLGGRKLARWSCDWGKPTVQPRGLILICQNQSQNVETAILKLVCMRGSVPDIVVDKHYDSAVHPAVMCMSTRTCLIVTASTQGAKVLVITLAGPLPYSLSFLLIHYMVA